MATITAPIAYTVPSGHDVVYTALQEASLIRPQHVPTEIADARPLENLLDLDESGFQLVDGSPAVADPRHPDYLVEVEKLVAELTGAVKVVSIKATVRDERDPGRSDYPPVRTAHVDANIDSYRRLVSTKMDPAEAEHWLRHRFAAINLWQPVFPVERTPLAVADARTIDPDDLVPVIMHKTPDDPQFTYGGWHLKYKPAQRFYYFPDMRPEEAVVFKLWDTGHDPLRFVPHTSFDDPTSAPDAPGRVSVDVRTVAFYEP